MAGWNWAEIPQLPSPVLPGSWYMDTAPETVCKPKIPSMSAVKLWARSWLPPLSIPLPFHYFFTLKRTKKKAFSSYLQQEKKIKYTPSLHFAPFQSL